MLKILSPAVALMNRLNYTRKFMLLWLMSLVAIAVVVYSLFVSLDRVIQPSRKELMGLALIEPMPRTVQLIQQHRGLSSVLLGGNEAMQDRRAATERGAAESFKAMEGALPPDLISSKDFQIIKADWERLRKEGLHWAADENYAAHTRLIEQLQLFELSVADNYALTLDTEITTFYLIDTTVNRLPHALEHLGQIRAYGTGILARNQITESQKARINALLGEFGSALNELRTHLEKTGRYNTAAREPLLAAYGAIADSARKITGLVESDILTGHFTTPPDVFLDMATAEIDKGYAQLSQALLPTAKALIEERIARAKSALYTSTGISMLLFLLVVYLSASIYYAVIGNIQSLVRSLHIFAEGDLSVRINLQTYDELSLVGKGFNEMAHKFSALLERQGENEARLRSTIETAMDAVVQMDAAGIITGWNNQAEKIFGWSSEEAVGRVLSETILPPQYREAHVNGLKRFLLSGKGAVLNSRIEMTGLHRDGHEFPVELSVAQIKAAGKYEFSAFIRDITERKQMEMVLRRSEENLNRAQTVGQIGSWLLDIPADRLEWSAETYRMFGIPQQEAINLEAFVAAIHPDDRDFVLNAWNDAMAGAPYDVEHRIVVGGQVRWVRERAQIERNAEGRPLTGIGTTQDITDRKLAEEALRASENRYRLLVESSPLCVHEIDLEGRLQSMNRAGLDMLGLDDAGKIRGVPYLGAVSQQDAGRVGALLQDAIAKGTTSHFEFAATGDASLYFKSCFVPIKDANGKVLKLMGITEDITENKRFERELRIAAAAFDAQEGITITDENGVIIRVNRTFTTITGYSAEEAIGNTPRVLKSGRHDSEFYRCMWENLLHNKFWQGEIWNKRKNGEIYPEWLTITAVLSEDGKTNNYVAIFLDITERKQAEAEIAAINVELEKANIKIEEERARLATRVAERTAQLQYANLAKDSFLATMSHEIRTPLGGLLGMMELVGMSRLDGEQREMLQAARDSGESLLRIVDDILDWSKIEAGKMTLAPQVAAIPDVLRKVASTYTQLASTKGLILRRQVDGRLGAAHLFDPLRLSQILNNFTSNAIKFTEHGTVEISAELIAQHGGTEQVRFCVKDTGIGIGMEQQARLFRHYEQASADTARMYGGTGLGLAICRSLAELMDGAISMESTPGSGSTFCFTVSLPVASPAAQRDFQLKQTRENSSNDIPDTMPLLEDGVSVLVVDDHPVNRMLLKRQLEQLGLHAEVAADGIVALPLWRSGSFDMVITDSHMPEMDGYELTRNIREMEQHGGRPRVPIIAWTANVLAEEEERCRAAGMDDMLTKPTELSDLRNMLLKWLAEADIPAAIEAPPTEMISVEAVQNQASADAPIDFSVLKKIAASHAAQAEMLQEFNLHNHNDIAGLKKALKDGNQAAVARSAHRIKGSSRMVGALELAGICTAIEKAAAQGDLSGAQIMSSTALDEAIKRIEAAISTFIAVQ